MKSVALLVQSSELGGVQRVIRNLAKGLQEKGHEVTIISCDGRGEAFKGLSADVRVLDLGARSSHGDGKIAVAMPRLRKVLKSEMLDVLIAAPGLAGQFALLTTRGLATRVIVMIDNRVSLIRAKSTLHALAYGIGVMLYRRASAIVMASDSALRDFKNTYPRHAGKAYRIYHPLIPDNVDELASEEPQLAMPSEGKTIVSAGRFVAEKDFPTLIKAVSLAVKAGEDVSLLILGDGELRESLERYARALGVADRVMMPGAVDNVYSYFKRADLFALTSVSEALGNVLIEALACGAPVIATRCESGGPQEVLQDGALGFLCDRGDARGIAEAISKALNRGTENTEKRKQRGKEFSIESSAEQYSSLIEGIQ